MKVSFCIPVHGETKAQFTMALASMVGHTASTRHDIFLQGHMRRGQSRIDKAREQLAEWAIAAEADWLLWLDADQTFPPDTLLRLLAHDKPFVGCHYPRRRPDDIVSAAVKDGKALRPKADGLETVDILPFGVALIRADVFKSLARPWFKMGRNGEDGYFCEQAVKAGFQPHVDHALSREVGHISEVVLRFPD